MNRGVSAIALLLSVPLTTSAAFANDTWQFAVSLDGKPIGHHSFTLIECNTKHGVRDELVSEAHFVVKVLFLTVYRYTHRSTERWQGDCLDHIDARTDDDGKTTTVSGARIDDNFAVKTTRNATMLNGCIMTFAYWNPRILKATQLLNSQTGEYTPVSVIYLGADTVRAEGVSQTAQHYLLASKDTSDAQQKSTPLKIDLWYSANKRWLALESTMPDGHQLRYQLQ